MNRRGFLDSILKAGVSAMILPSAVTYAGRVWKKQSQYKRLWIPQIETEIVYYADWEIWTKLLKNCKWEPNMGSTPIIWK